MPSLDSLSSERSDVNVLFGRFPNDLLIELTLDDTGLGGWDGVLRPDGAGEPVTVVAVVVVVVVVDDVVVVVAVVFVLFPVTVVGVVVIFVVFVAD